MGRICPPPDGPIPGPTWPWLATVGPAPARHLHARSIPHRPELRRSSGHRNINPTSSNVLNPLIRSFLSISHHFQPFYPKSQDGKSCKLKIKEVPTVGDDERLPNTQESRRSDERIVGKSSLLGRPLLLSPCSLSRLLPSLFSNF